MEILTNYSLQTLNTFHLKVDGKYFAQVASVSDILEVRNFADQKKAPLLILGGGSNLLFLEDYEGMVMKVNVKGLELLKETDQYVYLKVGAGEVWDDLVAHTVKMGWGGLENLSLIPGDVGASPVQNIGAYGVEMKDCFDSLEFFDFKTGTIQVFNNSESAFAYRNSIYKSELKGRGVVLTVTFRLNKNPEFHTGYGSIREELSKMGVKTPTLKALRDAVIRIRRSKLPDPDEIGNAGSFFKNPTVPEEIHNLLIGDFPNLVSFPQGSSTYKLAAGWLIDQCGWKGFRKGDAGVHKNQALVLVNYGNASGKQILELSEQVQESVLNRFHVQLEREVNVV